MREGRFPALSQFLLVAPPPPLLYLKLCSTASFTFTPNAHPRMPKGKGKGKRANASGGGGGSASSGKRQREAPPTVVVEMLRVNAYGEEPGQGDDDDDDDDEEEEEEEEEERMIKFAVASFHVEGNEAVKGSIKAMVIDRDECEEAGENFHAVCDEESAELQSVGCDFCTNVFCFWYPHVPIISLLSIPTLGHCLDAEKKETRGTLVHPRRFASRGCRLLPSVC